jgi:hypothetical protein
MDTTGFLTSNGESTPFKKGDLRNKKPWNHPLPCSRVPVLLYKKLFMGIGHKPILLSGISQRVRPHGNFAGLQSGSPYFISIELTLNSALERKKRAGAGSEFRLTYLWSSYPARNYPNDCTTNRPAARKLN